MREVASPDVGRMGIEILSFTIKDIEDKVNYLDSLGKTQTAKVKRDADIGVAESNRDAGIRVKFCLSFWDVYNYLLYLLVYHDDPFIIHLSFRLHFGEKKQKQQKTEQVVAQNYVM